MKKPVVISIGFHAAILLATLVVLPAPKPFEVKLEEAIQVDISQISDKTQQMATATDAPPKVDKPAPKQTKIVKDVPPAPKVADEVKTAANEPVVPPEPVVEKKPEPPKPKPPKPEEPKPLDPAAITDLLKKTEEPPPEKKPEPKPKETKVAEPKKPEKKKPELKVDDIAAFLDKQKGEKTAPTKPSDKAGAPKLAEKNTQGNDAAMSAKLGDQLGALTEMCFSPPQAAIGLDIKVPIHFQLNADGTVSGQPEQTESYSDPLHQAVARAAIAAVMGCQPYKLPNDVFDLWQDNVISFVPKPKQGT